MVTSNEGKEDVGMIDRLVHRPLEGGRESKVKICLEFVTAEPRLRGFHRTYLISVHAWNKAHFPLSAYF